MPVKALIHHPCHVMCGPLGVGKLPTQAAAVLLQGPCAGSLPHKIPADGRMVSTHGAKVILRSAAIRPGQQPLMKVALLLGRHSLASGMCVLQVAFLILNAAAIPRGCCAPAPLSWGLTRCIRAPRVSMFPRGSSGGDLPE